jgi:ABC-type multidrug transport system permease subunit
MLIERNEGILERCLVSGISGLEILFSHVTTQFIVMLGQSFLVLLFSFYVFDLTINTHIMSVGLLLVLTGLCGMSFGFVVSCSVDNERSATYMAMGSFLPLVMLCGVIWPIEGMHPLLKYFATFLPLTKSTESLRSMLQRGWSITEEHVAQGFVSTMVWIVIFLTISILLLKFKKG